MFDPNKVMPQNDDNHEAVETLTQQLKHYGQEMVENKFDPEYQHPLFGSFKNQLGNDIG